MRVFVRDMLAWIVYGLRYGAWRVSFAMARGGTVHGVRVKLAPVLHEEVGTRALQKVSAALNLIAEYDPRRMRRIARDMPWIWIQSSAYAPASFRDHARLCTLDREWVAAQENSPALIAAVLVHEATHARLFRRNIPYPEGARARVEALCDAQSAAFARRLPDGEGLARRMLDRRPDETYLSDETLHRRLSDAKPRDLDATRKDIEDSDLPAWLKKLLLRLVRLRAA